MRYSRTAKVGKKISARATFKILNKFPDAVRVEKFLNWLDNLLETYTRKGANHAKNVQ